MPPALVLISTANLAGPNSSTAAPGGGAPAVSPISMAVANDASSAANSMAIAPGAVQSLPAPPFPSLSVAPHQTGFEHQRKRPSPLAPTMSIDEYARVR